MPGISLSRCIGQPSKTIDVMFAGISMFWARLWLILARAIRWGLKWALRRAKDIFRPQKTKKNCVVCFKRAQRSFKNWKVRSLDILAESLGRNIYQWEQCWRSGESTGLPPMWPGFDSHIARHMRVEFVGSLFCSERFLPGSSGFPFSPKTNIWFDLICADLIFCLPN